MVCQHCQHARDMTSEWQVLMTITGQQINVQESIDLYMSNTELPDEVCASCGGKGSYITKIHEQIGDLLCIHLVDPGFMPLTQVVKLQNKEYFFLGCIVIYGSSDQNRHYTTIRNDGGTWFEFNDGVVQRIKMSKGRKKYKQYMMLYTPVIETRTVGTTLQSPIFPGPEFSDRIVQVYI